MTAFMSITVTERRGNGLERLVTKRVELMEHCGQYWLVLVNHFRIVDTWARSREKYGLPV
jgi:hypothetical protein